MHEVGRALEVGLHDDGTYDLIRDGAADLGIGLVRMERRRHRMAELFATTDEGGMPGGR